ncbi:MAG: YhgE/Pip family protein [Wujia sp.]
MIKEELKSLWKNKLLLVVLCAIILIPAIYAGFFLSSMWDPYGDLKYLPVAVVNKDKAVTYKGKELAVGDKLADSLRDNDSMAFNVVDEAVAEDGLRNGTYYMVVTIPENFSYNATTVMEEDPTKLCLEYETNPGQNYISMKLGESAMKEIKANITQEIVHTYAENVFDSLSDVEQGFADAVDGTQNMLDGQNQLKEGNQTITQNLELAADGAGKLQDGAGKLAEGTGTLNDKMGEFEEGANNLNKGLSIYTKGVKDLDTGLSKLEKGTGKLSASVPKLVKGVNDLKKGSKQTVSGVEKLVAGYAGDGTDENPGAAKGIQNLATGSTSLREGVESVADGTTALQAGANQIVAGYAGDGTLTNPGAVSGAQSVAQGAQTLAGSASAVQSGVSQLVTGAAQLKLGYEGNGTAENPGAKEGMQNLSDGLSSLNQQVQAITIPSMELTEQQQQQIREQAVQSIEEMGSSQEAQAQVAAGLAGNTNAASIIGQLVPAMMASGLSQEEAQAQATALVAGVYASAFKEGARFAAPTAAVLGAQGVMGEVGTQMDGFSTMLHTLKQGVQQLASGAQVLNTGVASLYDGTVAVYNGLAELNGNMSAFTQGAQNLAQGATSVSGGVNQLYSGTIALQTGINTLAQGTPQLKEGALAVESGAQSLNVGINGYTDKNGKKVSGLYGGTKALAKGLTKVDDGLESLKKSTGSLSKGVQQIDAGVKAARKGSKELVKNSPALTSGSKELASAAGQISEGVEKLDNGATELAQGANTLADGSGKLAAGSKELGEGLTQLEDGTTTLHDALADGRDEIKKNEVGDKSLDMFSDPVDTREETITKVENNGHAMAAYMMSVGLWVGCLAFCLMYPLVSYKGKFKNGFAWWASKAVVAGPVAILMAVVLMMILTIALGFEPVSWFKTLGVAMVTAVAFMTIMYFFNVCMGKVGSFLMLAFMVLQLTGSAGTYPIEVSGPLANALHAFMPFTYTVNAFRSVIAGGQSIRGELEVLFAISIVFTLLTIVMFEIRGRRLKEGKRMMYDWIEEHGLA